MADNQLYKITILGSEEVVKGFKILGLQVLTPSDESAAEKLLFELKEKNECAVLIITEDWASRLDAFLKEEFAKVSLPALVVVPGLSGPSGQGLLQLRRIVEQAVGSDILFNNN
jgi:V/A-type H+-transporting ATPase subunit F